MLTRTRLIRIQRNLYGQLRGYARTLLGSIGPELKKYFLEYQKDFRSFQAISSQEELFTALKDADLVFCGDYHTLAQAQRTVIHLLQECLAEGPGKRGILLALEMVSSRHNRAIQKYLGGKLSEPAFLSRIGFTRYWGFDWASYRALFGFAKSHGIQIVGINLPSSKERASLKERDRHAAQEIVKVTKKDPGALVFVLIGDLHLAESHLPKNVETLLSKSRLKRKKLVIHQNSDRLYWRLVHLGLEQKGGVIKIKEGVYCVINAPPWVKLQSHLRWAEVLATRELPSSPLTSARDPYAAIFSDLDFNDELRELMESVRSFLDLPQIEGDSFQVCGPLDKTFLRRKEKERQFTRDEIRALGTYVSGFRSHFIPRLNVIFLTNLSYNHAATQSSIYLHSAFSGFDRVFLRPHRDFYTFVWIEGIGFLGSKIINPKRRCIGYEDMRRWRKSPSPKPGEDLRLIRWVLSHYEGEKRWLSHRSSSLFPLLPSGPLPLDRKLFYYKAAKILGRVFGEALYQAIVEERISRDRIQRLFLQAGPLKDPEEAKLLYMKWVARLKPGSAD